MKKSLLALFVLLFLFTPAFSQDSECGTDFSNIRPVQKSEIIEDDGRRLRFGVIFHVLWNNADENVTERNILEALKTLQQDFLAVNADLVDLPDEFKGKLGNPNIEFVLADNLPVSERTRGIIRIPTSTKLFTMKGRRMFIESPVIDPKRYLNVYLCDLSGTNGFYISRNPEYDGIVIDYQLAKGKYRTITHEAGHWLRLCHIFGCERGDNCANDFVSDTPKQRQHGSCDRQKYPLTECTPKQSVMFMNFMDYGEARYFFTAEQVKGMRQHALVNRKPLPQSE